MRVRGIIDVEGIDQIFAVSDSLELFRSLQQAREKMGIFRTPDFMRSQDKRLQVVAGGFGNAFFGYGLGLRIISIVAMRVRE